MDSLCDATYSSGEIDKGVLAAHNVVRSQPKAIIPQLQAMLAGFDGLILKREGKINLRTNEGAAAVQELIDFLNVQEPLPTMTWSDEVAKAAKDHADDTGPKGITGHDGSDGSTLGDRLQKYGNPVSTYGENLSYGQDKAMDVVIQLLIDDGVQGRGHRTNIFNPAFRVMGCHTGQHKAYTYMTCIDYAGGFTLPGEANPMETQMNDFMKQDVEFPDMPADGFTGYSTSVQCAVQGTKVSKTVTRTVNMADGSQKILKQTVEMELQL